MECNSTDYHLEWDQNDKMIMLTQILRMFSTTYFTKNFQADKSASWTTVTCRVGAVMCPAFY